MLELFKVDIQYLSQIQMTYLYFSAILIYLAYFYQVFNIEKLLIKRTDLLQIDLLKEEVLFTLNYPSIAKFYLFPAMWTLLFVSIFIIIFFPGIGTKSLFISLAIILLVQNYFNYSNILDLALDLEKNPNKSIKDLFREREWTVIREKIKEKDIDTIINNSARIYDLKTLKFKTDTDSKYFKNKYEELFELYEVNGVQKLDKLNLILSSMFSQLYKEVDISKMYRNSILEAFFVILVLYFSLIIN